MCANQKKNDQVGKDKMVHPNKSHDVLLVYGKQAVITAISDHLPLCPTISSAFPQHFQSCNCSIGSTATAPAASANGILFLSLFISFSFYFSSILSFDLIHSVPEFSRFGLSLSLALAHSLENISKRWNSSIVQWGFYLILFYFYLLGLMGLGSLPKRMVFQLFLCGL